MKSLKYRLILALNLDYILCIGIGYIVGRIFLNFRILDLYTAGIVALLIGAVLFIIKDILFKNQSLGNQIFRLRICDIATNKVTSKSIMVCRSIVSLFVIGLDFYVILFTGKSIVDMLYKTKAVNKRDI